MRTVIVVMMLAVTTPLEASQSCMSKTEARQHFGSVHIYWHGLDHCWDSTPGRHHQIQSVRRKTPVDVVQKNPETPNSNQPNWRDSMSEMLPYTSLAASLNAQRDAQRYVNDDAVGDAPSANRPIDVEPSPLVTRWVDIAQVVPQPTIEQAPEPLRSAVLVLIAIVLTIGTVAIAFCVMTFERPRSPNI
jgi:hypothetical protein